eukprot:TRINITY_DN758_c0_g1_i5.p1 TRINITY_DN758_c0_g1~~TRINITY_DN758_c0_g1_i5.p1  ORF type:complete len:740 (-),score=142.62 TRINITY_DN758_c0_g1_i5:62-2281(-)
MLLVTLRSLIAKYGCITNDTIRFEAMLIVYRHDLEADGVDPTERLKRMGGKDWLAALKKRPGTNFLKAHVVKRPMEVERAMKAQPEFTLKHTRAFLYTMGLAQIHRYLGTGETLPGWVIGESGVVERTGDNSRTNDWGPDVLGVKQTPDGKILWNLVVDRALAYVPAHLHGNGDEKPCDPNSVMLRVIGHALSPGRQGFWTLTPFINASGDTIVCTIIMRGQSVSTEIAEIMRKSAAERGGTMSVGISASEKGATSDDLLYNTFSAEGGVVDQLKKRGLSRSNPAYIELDGHSSRITRKLHTYLCANHIYTNIMPSHTSTTHQACDNGTMSFLQNEFSARVSGWARANPQKNLYDPDRVRLILETLYALNDTGELINRAAFTRVGRENGIWTPEHIRPTVYDVGASRRNENLPPVDQNLLDQLNRPEMVIREPNAPQEVVMVGGKAVSAAEAEKYRERRGDYSPHHPGVARDQQAAALVAALASNDIAEAATFTEYVLQRHGDAATRSLTYRPKERSNAKHLEHLNLMASGEILEGGASDVISDELMEEARRGPAGRISTANGLMLFASSTGTALAEAWEISSEKARNNERISKERSARENLEGPLYQVMLDKGFVVPAQPTKKKKKGPSRRTITIAQLDHFNKAQRINHYPKSGNRDKKVAAILHFMKYAPEDVAWASVDETRPAGAFVILPMPVTARSETEEDLEEGGEIENPADLDVWNNSKLKPSLDGLYVKALL